jgi:hypothetical protein
MAKYGNNPVFKDVLFEFGNMMKGHFADLAKKADEETKRLEQEKARAEEIYRNEGATSLMGKLMKDDQVD